MKKAIVILICAALLCALSGCATGLDPRAQTPLDEPVSLLEFLGGEYAEFAQNFYARMPVAVIRATTDQSGHGDAVLYGEDAVKQAFSAMQQITVTAKSDIMVADSYQSFSYVFDDGSRLDFSFNNYNIWLGDACYIMENDDALWSLDFPMYGGLSSDMLTTVLDADTLAFYDGFYDAPPVAVRVESGGKTYQSDDPEAINDVFNLLSSLYISFGESAEYYVPRDQRELNIIFTSADGSEHGFLFSDRSFVAELPAPIGNMYYYVGDSILEELYALAQ